MTSSEDVYDVGVPEPGHMVCDDCGAVFVQWENVGDMYLDDTDSCPSCDSERVHAQSKEPNADQ